MDSNLKDYVAKVLSEEPEEDILGYVEALKSRGIRKPSQLKDDLLQRSNLFDKIPEVFVNLLFTAWRETPAEPRPSTSQVTSTSPLHVAFNVNWDDLGHKRDLESEFVTESKKRAILRDAAHQIIDALGCRNPGRRVIREVAEEFARKFPRHFCFAVDGHQTAGYTSTFKRLEKQIEYIVSRGNNKSADKKRKSYESHATRNFAPELPTDEDELAEMHIKREALLKIYSETRVATWDFKLILNEMTSLFSLVRDAINNDRLSIERLTELWPFLFVNTECMLAHYEMLMEQNAQEMLNNFLRKESDFLQDYFTTRSSKHLECSKFKLQMTAARTSDPENTSHAPLLALLMMVTTYLNPGKLNVIFRHVKVRETSKLELEALQDLPSTPLIFALGQNQWSCDKYYIMIEGRIVARVETFEQALIYFFTSYFVFNMHYPDEGAETMEFIERYMMGIIPKDDDGGKKKKKNKTIKLQNLKSDIAEYKLMREEWLATDE